MHSSITSQQADTVAVRPNVNAGGSQQATERYLQAFLSTSHLLYLSFESQYYPPSCLSVSSKQTLPSRVQLKITHEYIRPMVSISYHHVNINYPM